MRYQYSFVVPEEQRALLSSRDTAEELEQLSATSFVLVFDDSSWLAFACRGSYNAGFYSSCTVHSSDGEWYHSSAYIGPLLFSAMHNKKRIENYSKPVSDVSEDTRLEVLSSLKEALEDNDYGSLVVASKLAEAKKELVNLGFTRLP